jgi:hypothetical protein
MKFLALFIAVMMIFIKSHAQVITDTSRCSGGNYQGSIKFLIDEFKSRCLERDQEHNFVDVAFSNVKTVSFLNHIFDTHIFNHYCFLEKSSSRIEFPNKSRNIILGMIEISFESKKDIEKATHRSVFNLEVATPFILLKEKSTIVIVFAEVTSLNRDTVSCFFNRLKALKGQYVSTL